MGSGILKLPKKKQTQNEKLIAVRNTFDQFNLISALHSYFSIENSNSQLTYDEPDDIKNNLSPEQIKDLLAEMNDAMKKAALELDFEEAAKLRDRIFELENLL